ncbi:MAG: MoxR family ATPase [Spirochaetaceae bacterium]|nr:MAG: MoxR family ATPase [Spirochaetaceae bacterium]
MKIEQTGNARALAQVSRDVRVLMDNIRSVIYMNPGKLEYCIASYIAGGHVILADSHGVGKTSLARALAGSIQWEKGSKDFESFSRIQCTVDLLPQDILGYNKIEPGSNKVSFKAGPIFAHFVLCDEINLLTPKTQGSFFQAMEEQNVTVEGTTFCLPNPFFIIATMNLKGAHLFPLPAPQLDRFMVELSLGFPSLEDEVKIITQHGRTDGWKNFKPVISEKTILGWQTLVDHVEIHPEIVDYIARLVRETRINPEVQSGASPRTGVKISRFARALELIRGRNFVSADTVKEIFITACAHRLVPNDPVQSKEKILEDILRRTPVEKRKS